ncbi:hypothetical protein MMC14_002872 [Varicellaria rhodocarpa]|nr:hypothetical protein [Varicellaria rhodocarpa]
MANIQSLPGEIRSLVCSAADNHSLAQLRLVHIPEYTDIALQEMVRHIHLVCHYRSFDRFHNIAQQSLEKRSYVRSITYEMDHLPKFADRTEWLRNVYDERIQLPIPQKPPGDCSSSHKEFYDRQMAKFFAQRRHRYTVDQLETGWSQYQELYRSMTAFLEDRNDDNARIINRLSRFRRLESLEAYKRHPKGPSDTWRKFFGPALIRPSRNDADCGYMMDCFFQALGIQALRDPNLWLRRLSVTPVDWASFEYFSESQPAPQAVLYAVKDLHYLTLEILTSLPQAREPREMQRPVIQCNNYLRGGTMRVILQKAQELRELKLLFTGYKGDRARLDWDQPCYPTRFQDLFATGFHWSRLETLALHNVEATETDILSFLRLHRASLRNVDFKDLSLSQGLWPAIFGDMRDNLDLVLETLSLQGIFHSLEDRHDWDLGDHDEWDFEAERRMKRLVNWILKKEPETRPTNQAQRVWNEVFEIKEREVVILD